MCFSIEQNICKWKNLVLGEQQVKVFEYFGLETRISTHTTVVFSISRTSQRLSMLSLREGEIAMVLFREENPSPSGMVKYYKKACKVCQPYSW
jgi:hypothetical protein